MRQEGEVETLADLTGQGLGGVWGGGGTYGESSYSGELEPIGDFFSGCIV